MQTLNIHLPPGSTPAIKQQKLWCLPEPTFTPDTKSAKAFSGPGPLVGAGVLPPTEQDSFLFLKSRRALYVNDYVAHINGRQPLHPLEYEKRYQYSTLPYFHDILGIESSE